MLNLINQIVARAKANRQRIVLPEGTEERTLKAANMILTDEVADLILLGKPAEINELATKWGLGNIGKATIIDPETSPKHEEYAQLLCELRKKNPAIRQTLHPELHCHKKCQQKHCQSCYPYLHQIKPRRVSV